MSTQSVVPSKLLLVPYWYQCAKELLFFIALNQTLPAFKNIRFIKVRITVWKTGIILSKSSISLMKSLPIACFGFYVLRNKVYLFTQNVKNNPHTVMGIPIGNKGAYNIAIKISLKASAYFDERFTSGSSNNKKVWYLLSVVPSGSLATFFFNLQRLNNKVKYDGLRKAITGFMNELVNKMKNTVSIKPPLSPTL